MKREKMDWIYSKPQIDNAFSSLGGICGDDYMVGDKAIGKFIHGMTIVFIESPIHFYRFRCAQRNQLQIDVRR